MGFLHLAHARLLGAGQLTELLKQFASTFVLTLSNPATIFSFIAIFGSMAGRAGSSSPALMVLGVLIGSALWWLMLSSAVGRLRERFDAVATLQRRALDAAATMQQASAE